MVEVNNLVIPLAPKINLPLPASGGGEHAAWRYLEFSRLRKKAVFLVKSKQERIKDETRRERCLADCLCTR